VSVATLLAELRDRDIHVWADENRLRCNAPAGALTPELREQLQERKDDILQFLRSAASLAQRQRAIVPLQPLGDLAPVFAVPGHNGDVFCYRALAQHLGDNQPFFGLQPPGVDGQAEPLDSVGRLARYFADQIAEFRPAGACIIAGYCAGGSVAFELAQQLRQRGVTVDFVALFGSPYARWYRPLSRLRWRVAGMAANGVRHARTLATGSWGERRAFIAGKLRQLVPGNSDKPAALEPHMVARMRVEQATLKAAGRYSPARYSGRVALFIPSTAWLRLRVDPLGWRRVAENIEEYVGPDACDGDNMLREAFAPATARLFAQCRDRARPGSSQDR
jgi:thioesterase domain-containing protein